MKTLYFDCFAGASGNMILGALVSLGIDSKKLVSEIETLPFSDFNIDFSAVNRSGIEATLAKTTYREESVERHLSDIKKIIIASGLTNSVKEKASDIFAALAAAEARIHGIAIEEVHFHEVGAMDAIIDVVGACIGFEMLGIESFACSKIHTGSGFIDIAHGKYPVPPPAVIELLSGLPIYSTEIEGELITPTGAAIISTLCTRFGSIPDMKVEKTGYGAGSRTYERFPNALRMIIGEEAPEKSSHELDNSHTPRALTGNLESSQLTLIESNLDDIPAETLGYVMDKALNIGALDCWFTPIQMKKNRPATMLSVLCENRMEDDLISMLFLETTTLGVRISRIERKCLPRESQTIRTDFGDIEFKIARFGKKVINVKPEFDDVRKAALKSGLSFKEIEARIMKNFDEKEKGIEGKQKV